MHSRARNPLNLLEVQWKMELWNVVRFLWGFEHGFPYPVWLLWSVSWDLSSERLFHVPSSWFFLAIMIYLHNPFQGVCLWHSGIWIPSETYGSHAALYLDMVQIKTELYLLPPPWYREKVLFWSLILQVCDYHTCCLEFPVMVVNCTFFIKSFNAMSGKAYR